VRARIVIALLVSLGGGRASAGEPARTGVLSEVTLSGSRVFVPPGWFVFGASKEEQALALSLCQKELTGLQQACSAQLFAGEGPERRIFLPGFYIDRTEVTNARYRRCVEAGTCDPAPLLDADPRLRDPGLPVVRATWFDADRYCRFVGMRLPSEIEWERAARGPLPVDGKAEDHGRVFPWGDAPVDGRANTGRFVVLDPGGPYARPAVRVDERDGYAFLAPPGSFPSGASAEGVLDLAGNASEWVADAIGEEGPPRKPGAPQVLGANPRRMLRGGSYRQPLLYTRTTAWESAAADLRSPEVGFRCAKDR
jgi:formylglycine-generating enzyme required for sulfatase activity